MVTKAGITNPKAHLESLFPGGMALVGAYVAPSLVEQLDAAAEEALGAGSWADCAPLAPAALAGGDAAELVARCPAVQALGARAHVIREFGIVPHDGIRAVWQRTCALLALQRCTPHRRAASWLDFSASVSLALHLECCNPLDSVSRAWCVSVCGTCPT